MYLDNIIKQAEKHGKENNIKSKNMAFNIPNGRPGGWLINLDDKDTLKYAISGKYGKINFSYFEPIIEVENKEKICTYVIYS